ncbi:hypothetical protein niasHT_000876 [Heterodera trifolii]|uniref:Uncharacterized protein n=1 Tax=Heterodera trifolii TaxID=157864 RepID=A0ABD2M7H4_9BILA
MICLLISGLGTLNAVNPAEVAADEHGETHSPTTLVPKVEPIETAPAQQSREWGGEEQWEQKERIPKVEVPKVEPSDTAPVQPKRKVPKMEPFDTAPAQQPREGRGEGQSEQQKEQPLGLAEVPLTAKRQRTPSARYHRPEFELSSEDEPDNSSDEDWKDAEEEESDELASLSKSSASYGLGEDIDDGEEEENEAMESKKKRMAQTKGKQTAPIEVPSDSDSSFDSEQVKALTAKIQQGNRAKPKVGTSSSKKDPKQKQMPTKKNIQKAKSFKESGDGGKSKANLKGKSKNMKQMKEKERTMSDEEDEEDEASFSEEDEEMDGPSKQSKGREIDDETMAEIEKWLKDLDVEKLMRESSTSKGTTQYSTPMKRKRGGKKVVTTDEDEEEEHSLNSGEMDLSQSSSEEEKSTKRGKRILKGKGKAVDEGQSSAGNEKPKAKRATKQTQGQGVGQKQQQQKKPSGKTKKLDDLHKNVVAAFPKTTTQPRTTRAKPKGKGNPQIVIKEEKEWTK